MLSAREGYVYNWYSNLWKLAFFQGNKVI